MCRLLQPLILAMLLIVSSCDTPWCKKDFSDRILQYYKNQMSSFYGAAYEFTSKPSKPQDFLLQLTEVIPFDWDSMVWISDSLESGGISKIIGTQYEEEDMYKGKQKLIFMNGSEIVDIYVLRAQDSVSFIPGDVHNGYAKVPWDACFTVRASDTAFVLKRFGVSNIHTPKSIAENSIKKAPRFEIEHESFTFGLSSDTVKSKREYYSYGWEDFDLRPLAKKIAHTVFTETQISRIKKEKFLVFIAFNIYMDTGEIFECYGTVDPRYRHLFSDRQLEQLSEMMFNMRIDPRMISQPYHWFKCPAGKRAFVYWGINITYSI